MTYGSQNEVVAFLSALDGGAMSVVATHISIVVVCRTRAFKLKRAVVFPYLDFSSPQKRLAMCEREAALNRRTAPALYLGARRITRAAGGALAFGGAGDLVDAVVEMRKFDEDALFDRLAASGRLTKEMIEALAQTIAAFHDSAEVDRERGGLSGMARVVALNADSCREARLADAPELDARAALLEETLRSHGALLDARRAHGKIRRCHGDLTLRNICLLDRAPTPFDCLEFSDELATIDVLYDLAFLLMDLWRARRRDFANLALNRYLDHCDETDGLPLLPLFMSLRAMIRAHVDAARDCRVEARAYYDLAGELLRAPAPRIVAIGGLSGAGKSSVAAHLAPELGAAPGARVVNSDRLRKQMFGVAPTARLPQTAYASEVSARVYASMFDEARRVAKSGWPAIVDAVFDRLEDREAIEGIARGLDVPFHGFWLDAGLEQRAARVDARRNDVSDATREVLLRQIEQETGAIQWARIDAARDRATIVADIKRRME